MLPTILWNMNVCSRPVPQFLGLSIDWHICLPDCQFCSGDEESEEIAGLLEPPPASIDEEYVEALDNGTLGTGSDEKESEEDEGEDVEDLKQQLIDSLYGTQRGLRASSDTRAEVVELITQLEARNPTPAPTEALTLLNGKWILA
jgi:hypothetical protein